MRKYDLLINALLIASCLLLAGGLSADPVTFTISSLTGETHDNFSQASFSGSGSSSSGETISIAGSGGHASPGQTLTTPGMPLNLLVSFGLDCNDLGGGSCLQGGFVSIAGIQYSVALGGANPALHVSAATSLTFQAGTSTYVISGASVQGEYTAFCFEDPRCATGTVLGNVLINLPGYVTLSFGGPTEFGAYPLETDTFTSTPEPASIGLLLLGVAAIGATVCPRRRKALCGSMYS